MCLLIKPIIKPHPHHFRFSKTQLLLRGDGKEWAYGTKKKRKMSWSCYIELIYANENQYLFDYCCGGNLGASPAYYSLMRLLCHFVEKVLLTLFIYWVYLCNWKSIFIWLLLWWQPRRVSDILFAYVSFMSLCRESPPHSIYILSLFMQLKINIYLILLGLDVLKFYIYLVILFWYIYYLDITRNIIY